MFPGAGASVQYNEAGEPVSWDYPGRYDDSPGDDDPFPDVYEDEDPDEDEDDDED